MRWKSLIPGDERRTFPCLSLRAWLPACSLCCAVRVRVSSTNGATIAEIDGSATVLGEIP